jgi:outer membrane immunogenic protein
MRKIALVIAALAVSGTAGHAADLAVQAPVYTKAPVIMPFNWTGFYIGGQGGFAWGQSELYDPSFGSTGLFNTHGGFGGGTVGYNWQITNWVLGLEGDFSGSNIKGSTDGLNGTYGCGIVPECVSEVKWFGTARARLGYAYDTWLFYGTGGAAFGRVHTFIANPVVPGFDGTKDRIGWTAGAGIEHAFTPHWSAKLEYLHVDLGNDFQWDSVIAGLTRSRFDLIRGGINYRF